jgi:hypothetical protein
MADASNREEWKKIAEQIQQETDFAKLRQLVKKLCDAFDRAKMPVEHQPTAQGD